MRISAHLAGVSTECDKRSRGTPLERFLAAMVPRMPRCACFCFDRALGSRRQLVFVFVMDQVKRGISLGKNASKGLGFL